MHKKILSGLFISCLFFQHAFAQQKLDLESLVPPAPNAQELGKYGTIPVGTITGVPDISLPLYQVISGSLKLPITLSYHASGVQVNEKSTDVGLGWSISAGGQISRSVFGAKDESTYGYFNYTAPSYSSLAAITNYYTMAQYNIVNNTGYDQEPDLFVYSMGVKSGKFIYTKSSTFQTIPFDPVIIQKIGNGNSLTFKITDENGVIYNFDSTSSTTSQAQLHGTDGSISYTDRPTRSTWYLSSMISADLVDTISFVYDHYSNSDYMEGESLPIGGTGYCTGSGDGTVQKTNNPVTYNELVIRKIIFKNGYV